MLLVILCLFRLKLLFFLFKKKNQVSIFSREKKIKWQTRNYNTCPLRVKLLHQPVDSTICFILENNLFLQSIVTNAGFLNFIENEECGSVNCQANYKMEMARKSASLQIEDINLFLETRSPDFPLKFPAILDFGVLVWIFRRNTTHRFADFPLIFPAVLEREEGGAVWAVIFLGVSYFLCSA